MEEHIIFNTEDVQNNKIFGILAYIGILFLVPLLAAKDSQYAKFHANQGFVLFIAVLILQVVGRTVAAILNAVTFGVFGNLFTALISLAIGICSIVFMVLGIMNACSGEPKKLPIIGGITLLK